MVLFQNLKFTKKTPRNPLDIASYQIMRYMQTTTAGIYQTEDLEKVVVTQDIPNMDVYDSAEMVEFYKNFRFKLFMFLETVKDYKNKDFETSLFVQLYHMFVIPQELLSFENYCLTMYNLIDAIKEEYQPEIYVKILNGDNLNLYAYNKDYALKNQFFLQENAEENYNVFVSKIEKDPQFAVTDNLTLNKVLELMETSLEQGYNWSKIIKKMKYVVISQIISEIEYEEITTPTQSIVSDDYYKIIEIEMTPLLMEYSIEQKFFDVVKYTMHSNQEFYGIDTFILRYYNDFGHFLSYKELRSCLNYMRMSFIWTSDYDVTTLDQFLLKIDSFNIYKNYGDGNDLSVDFIEYARGEVLYIGWLRIIKKLQENLHSFLLRDIFDPKDLKFREPKEIRESEKFIANTSTVILPPVITTQAVKKSVTPFSMQDSWEAYYNSYAFGTDFLPKKGLWKALSFQNKMEYFCITAETLKHKNLVKNKVNSEPESLYPKRIIKRFLDKVLPTQIPVKYTPVKESLQKASFLKLSSYDTPNNPVYNYLVISGDDIAV